MQKINIFKLIKYFLFNSYLKLSIVSGICFIIDLCVFSILIFKLSIFNANIISASIAIILDYIIATRKVFENSYKKK